MQKIVSGGQTGADRAALDWALAHGITCGGWCPKGRQAEDGCLGSGYPLKETPTDRYIERTEWNVRDSDGTVIFTIATILTGGPRRTAEFAAKLGKPVLHLAKSSRTNHPVLLRRFVDEHGIEVLNVAGSRASKEPDVGGFVMDVLSHAFGGGATREDWVTPC